jgi:hypothetical protein
MTAACLQTGSVMRRQTIAGPAENAVDRVQNGGASGSGQFRVCAAPALNGFFKLRARSLIRPLTPTASAMVELVNYTLRIFVSNGHWLVVLEL